MQTESSPFISEIIEKYSPMVLRLAYARTRSMADAEDLCQEVMLRLFRLNPHFESEEHRKAWLIRTTLYLSGNLFRSAWRRVITLCESPRAAPESKPPESVLSAALERLPPRYRTVVHLFYYEDMSTNEIAEMLNAKPATIRTQLTRARRMLQHELSDQEGEAYVQRRI